MNTSVKGKQPAPGDSERLDTPENRLYRLYEENKALRVGLKLG
jgi:hypothetical protein